MDLFDNNSQQDMALISRYSRQKKAADKRHGLRVGDKIKLRRIGASPNGNIKHLDRKIRKAYPRGPVMLRMIELEY